MLFLSRRQPIPGATMRKLLILLIAFSSLQLVSQTAAPAAKKPAPKKPSAAATAPTAIIDTTAGKLPSVLFPDKAPIGVANFIGLSRGTKVWTNPATGRKMRAVRLNK